MAEASPTSRIDVSIIIVDWNTAAYLRGCLRSIVEQTRSCTDEGGGRSTQRSPRVAVNMYVHQHKSLLRFHRKNRGLISWALAQAVYAVMTPLRSAALAGPALVGRGERSRKKFLQSAAARYHLLRIEPQS